MKKILITGANSYIGTSFERYMNNCNNNGKYQISTIDMRGSSWRMKSFAGFDTVYHVAGIVHRKETKSNAPLYYKVNRDLAVETAKKAKHDGVRQFIYLSTMSVYGMDTGVITKETIPHPKTHYGMSKLQAEEALIKIADDFFKVVVLRPPMVYGDGCRGNYNAIVRWVSNFPVFPKVNNERSAIYIDNLSGFVKMAVDRGLSGVFFPQDQQYSNTTNMARRIADSMNKKLYASYLFGFIARMLVPVSGKAKKAFGSLIYKNTEDFGFEYCGNEGM